MNYNEGLYYSDTFFSNHKLIKWQSLFLQTIFNNDFIRLKVTVEEFQSMFFDVEPSESNPLGLGDPIPVTKGSHAVPALPLGKSPYSEVLTAKIGEQVSVAGEPLLAKTRRSPYIFKSQPPYIRFHFYCCLCGVRKKKADFNAFAELEARDGAVYVAVVPHHHNEG